MAHLLAKLAGYVAGGKRDTASINSSLLPWTNKISFLTDPAAVGMPVSTILSLTASSSNSTPPETIIGDFFVFYVSASSTTQQDFEMAKAKAYDLPKGKFNKFVIIDHYMDGFVHPAS